MMRAVKEGNFQKWVIKVSLVFVKGLVLKTMRMNHINRVSHMTEAALKSIWDDDIGTMGILSYLKTTSSTYAT